MATSTPTVLKPRHSLAGKSLVPVILRLKSLEGEDVMELARLKRGYPLEDYSLVELRMEFERLTGESVKDVLGLAGKDDNLDTVRVLMHFSIEHANNVGAPRGQLLQSIDPVLNGTPSRSSATGGLSDDVDVSTVSSDASTRKVSGIENINLYIF